MKPSVTIIGAGIVGVATALTLRREGYEVTVVDMRPPGEYCSFGNAGILSPGSCVPLATPGIHWKVPGYLSDPLGPLTVRWSYLPKAAPWLLRFLAASTPSRVDAIADALRPLLRHTFDAYVPLAKDAGVSDLIRQSGYVVAYEKRASYEADHLAWKLRRDRGVVVEEIDARRLGELVPQLRAAYEVGLHLPDHGYVANPGRLVKALASAFERDRGAILQRRVLEIDIGAQGPRALLTDGGSLPVETLVICAGAHSNEFTARLGDNVPLEAERGYHVTYSDPRVTLPMPIFLPEYKFFVTPMEMGLRIAGQTEFAGINAEPNYARAGILAKHMERLFPQISTADTTKWMGRRPSMPDSLPVIGRSTHFANTFYAFGHGHIGLCGGAPTARIITDLIAGREPNIDITPFRASRFS